ncbi:MAG: HAD family hydrolase [Dehalococcoidia bacterium]
MISGFQAIIFDMDGVLVDSEPIFLNAVNRLLQREGVEPVSEADNEKHLIGTTVGETWRRLKEMRRLPEPTDLYISKYDDIVREVLSEPLPPQPGVTRLLETCARRGLPTAVASSSLRSWVGMKLNALGLQNSFDVILGGDDVTRGKPEPDIYLLAAERLGFSPENCIAIEDSPVGVASAVAARTYTIAVRTFYTRNMDVSQAHTILETLEDFDLSILANGRG